MGTEKWTSQRHVGIAAGTRGIWPRGLGAGGGGEHAQRRVGRRGSRAMRPEGRGGSTVRRAQGLLESGPARPLSSGSGDLNPKRLGPFFPVSILSPGVHFYFNSTYCSLSTVLCSRYLSSSGFGHRQELRRPFRATSVRI